MPDETTDVAPPKGGLVADWKKLATWQKAGVLIGGAALVVAVLMFINREPAPTATGNSALPSSSAEGFPGQGDTFPPMPVPPVSQGPPPAPKPGPTPAKPVALPPVRRAPAPAPKKPSPAKKTTAQGDQVFSHVIPVGLRGRL